MKRKLFVLVFTCLFLGGCSFNKFLPGSSISESSSSESSAVISSEHSSSSETSSDSSEVISSDEPSSLESYSSDESSQELSSEEHSSHEHSSDETSHDHSGSESSSELESSSGSSSNEESSGSESSHDHSHPESITSGAMSINFLELGNYHTGDSVFIKAGDTDILIDAGSIKSSSTTIKNFIDQYCTDGKLEYVIATHAHQDHIAGFVGSNAAPGIFKTFKIGTLIDFALTNSTSALYNDYCTLRESKLASGDIEHHFTARECIEETGEAKKEYTLAESITMTILDQRYYYENSSDENNYSVCTLFTQGSNHYLFTGDLEKEGEESLVEKNTLPHVQLFKAGHHGSKTSNTNKLLSVITPEVVCVCCCAGNDEYTKAVDNQFPTQQTIDNVAKYTDQIFVTTVTTDGHTGYESMNGNITFYCATGTTYTVTGSNNSTILKETAWFKENRTWPSGGK